MLRSSLGRLATASRALSTEAAPLKATLFPGDGVGPEIAQAVTLVLQTAGVPMQWDVQTVSHDKPDPRTNSFISRENLDSVKARRGASARLLSSLTGCCSATALG